MTASRKKAPSAEEWIVEREIYEACGDDYGYLCLVLQVVDEP